MIEYVSKTDAMTICAGHDGLAFAIFKMKPADVVPMEILKAEIYKLKCQQDCKNHEYYTGYMSALSTVEGILAEMGEE